MLVTFPTCQQILRQRAQNCPHVTNQQTEVWHYKQKGSVTVKIKRRQNKTFHLKETIVRMSPDAIESPEEECENNCGYISSLSPSCLVCSQLTKRKGSKTLARHTKSCIQTHRAAGFLAARRTAVRGEIRRHLRRGCPRLAVLTIINIFLFQ